MPNNNLLSKEFLQAFGHPTLISFPTQNSSGGWLNNPRRPFNVRLPAQDDIERDLQRQIELSALQQQIESIRWAQRSRNPTRRLVFRFNRSPADDSWRPGGVVLITVYDLDQGPRIILSSEVFPNAAHAVSALPLLEYNFGPNATFFYRLGDGAISSERPTIMLLVLSDWMPDGSTIPPPYPFVAGRVAGETGRVVDPPRPQVENQPKQPIRQISAGRRVFRRSDLDEPSSSETEENL